MEEWDIIDNKITETLRTEQEKRPLLLYDETEIAEYFAIVGPESAHIAMVDTLRDYARAILPEIELAKEEFEELSPPATAEEFHQEFASYLSEMHEVLVDQTQPTLTFEELVASRSRMSRIYNRYSQSLYTLLSELDDRSR